MKRFDFVTVKPNGLKAIVMRVIEPRDPWRPLGRFGVIYTEGFDYTLHYFGEDQLELVFERATGIDARTSSDDVPAAEPSIALPPLHYRHKQLHWVYHDGGGARIWRVYTYWHAKDERDGRGWCDDTAQYWSWPEMSKFGWNYAGPAIPPEVGEQPDVPVGAVACEAAEETFDAKTARLERAVLDAVADLNQRPFNQSDWLTKLADAHSELKFHLAAAPETDGAMLERLGDDASKWAQEFMKMRGTVETIDEALMTGWFANAIEHSHALRIARIKAVSRERIQAAMARFGWMPGGGYDEQVASMLGDLIDGRPIELTGEKPVEPWSREDIRSLAISYCSAMEGISASHDGSERFTFRGARLYEFVYRILAGEKP